jgi:hypothetical protein
MRAAILRPLLERGKRGLREVPVEAAEPEVAETVAGEAERPLGRDGDRLGRELVEQAPRRRWPTQPRVPRWMSETQMVR